MNDHADRLLVRDGLDETVIVEAAAGHGEDHGAGLAHSQRARRAAGRASIRSSP